MEISNLEWVQVQNDGAFRDGAYSHGARGDPHGGVIQCADQRIDFVMQRRFSELLWKAPELAAAGDRRMIVEKHAV